MVRGWLTAVNQFAIMFEDRFKPISGWQRSDWNRAGGAIHRVPDSPRKYISTALLLDDELGFEPMTRQEAACSSPGSYRYGRGTMLTTTNKSIRDWADLLAGDGSSSPLDRPLHRSHLLKGHGYRLRDLADALKLAHA